MHFIKQRYCAPKIFYLVFDLLHGSGVTFADSTLMVTEDGDFTVSTVVGKELLGHIAVGGSELLELVLEGERGVEGTENLGRQTRH